MARKRTGGEPGTETTAPSFEEALAELQQIVADLEEGSLGLEESLARFETGMKLLRTCHQVLERAEQKIAILTGFDAEGNPVTAPFDGSATFNGDAVSSSGIEPASAGRRRTSGRKSVPEPGTCDAGPGEPLEDDPQDERGLFSAGG